MTLFSPPSTLEVSFVPRKPSAAALFSASCNQESVGDDAFFATVDA
jgi:hypothetical protein